MQSLIFLRVRQFLFASTLACCVCGCADNGVREDRSINFSSEADSVAFQHGDQGVYIASDAGQKLEKIFNVDKETIAVSSPLWSPIDKRLIFTTARAVGANESSLPKMPSWEADPEGNVYQPHDIVYTCLLRPAPTGPDDAAQEPVELFKAACDHTGYVAANLAVRWHPDGRRILFVDRTGHGRHGLFEFDLASRQRRQILPHTAAALIFDWSPGHGYLTCVLANKPAEPLTDGIWVRPIDDATGWWRVPNSAVSYRSHHGALLEQLRGQRPAWSSDDQRFAFVARKHTPGDPTAKAAKDIAETNSIVCVKLSSRSALQLFESDSPLRDLHWHPAGDRLGFVQKDEAPVVRIVRRLDAPERVLVSPPVSGTGVRQFAGWNHDGTRLAYITPDVISTQAGDDWAFLFPPVRDARDRVYVVDGDDGPGHVVHWGMRITFPQWSPQEDTLSLWGTYSPTYGSWMSLFGLRSLRPGDPAAILDCGSGRMHWLAVNADEKVQVAHYYLLKRNYEEAWRWYEEAAEGREPAKPLELSDLARVARQLGTRRDATFFEYVCLTKLGRQDEAAERLAEFRASMKVKLGDAADAEEIDENGKQQLQRWATALAALSRDFYIAEVFLSLDAVNDAVAFFRQQESLAETDYERLANSLCLSQLLLIGGDREAYVVQVTGRLLPLLTAIHASLPSAPPPDEQSDLFQFGRNFEQIFVVGLGGAALAPMFSADFLADISDESLDRHIQSWLAAREQTDNGTAHLAIDLFLHAAYARCGMDELGESAARRIRNNPVQQQWLDGKGVKQMDEMIEQARRFAW